MQGVGWTIVMANCNNIFKDPETEIIKKNMKFDTSESDHSYAILLSK